MSYIPKKGCMRAATLDMIWCPDFIVIKRPGAMQLSYHMLVIEEPYTWMSKTLKKYVYVTTNATLYKHPVLESNVGTCACLALHGLSTIRTALLTLCTWSQSSLPKRRDSAKLRSHWNMQVLLCGAYKDEESDAEGTGCAGP